MIGLILEILFGALAGWIASKIMKTQGGWLRNIIFGIVGGFVGGRIAALIGLPGGMIMGLIVAVAGACLVIWLVNKFFK